MAFRESCGNVFRAMDAHDRFFWHRRFTAKYDTESHTNTELMRLCQTRNQCVIRTPHFGDADHAAQDRIMATLFDLVNQSYSTGNALSNNMMALQKFCKNGDLLKTVLNFNVTGRMRTDIPFRRAYSMLICVLFPFSRFNDGAFNVVHTFGRTNRSIRYRSAVYDFRTSQWTVYALTRQTPIFFHLGGQTMVNTEWLMHCTNFWRYHMTASVFSGLHEAYQNLSGQEKVRGWDEKLIGLHMAKPIGVNYYGMSSFLTPHDIGPARSHNTALVIDDNLREKGKQYIQHYEFTWIADRSKILWPPAFEGVVRAIMGRNLPAAKHFAVHSYRPIGHNEREV
ncbi:hypothetical protein ANO11243_057380 [Dothideomycetidae sp. 11243]|nr:hypothetical protein ANO11243_057380 [fungal sp. No.11243]